MYASYESMYLWCTSVNCMIRPVGSYSWDSLIFRGQFVMANELHRKWPWDFRALWWFEVGGGGAVLPLTGSLDYLCSGGSDTCKFMIMFRDFPVHHAWFGLVIHHDPCNMVQQKTTFYDFRTWPPKTYCWWKAPVELVRSPVICRGLYSYTSQMVSGFLNHQQYHQMDQQRWWWSLLSHRAFMCCRKKLALQYVFFWSKGSQKIPTCL